MKRIGIVAWIVVGSVAGILAGWVMTEPDPGGIMTADLTSILAATLGGIILLAVYRPTARRTA